MFIIFNISRKHACDRHWRMDSHHWRSNCYDTNIANIAGLLNLDWQIPGFQENDASPGGALAFELLKEVRTGQRYVRLAYYAQTPQQLRQATPLNLDNPPGMVAVG